MRIREAAASDLEPLLALARLLDTVNLPNDRRVLAELLERSERAFAGGPPAPERLYVFVLEHEGRIVGTSQIHAQHGTRRAPHVFFDVLAEERYSETLDEHRRHRVLRIGYDYDGPTEIGGLILAPECRGAPEQLGKGLSFARFLFLAAHRAAFRDEVLAELLPPLEPDGTSRLWECLGRRFTGMSYQDADRLSQKNKEFIRALFPQDPLYTTLLPPEVQAQIGQVGPNTKGVERMLRAIGFSYANRIDPFDGGPHFTAATDRIALVRATERAEVVDGAPAAMASRGLVATVRDRAPRFAVCRASYRARDGQIALDEAARRTLDVVAGDVVWVQPADTEALAARRPAA